MSIKTKLSLFISFGVALILALNTVFFYFSSRDNLKTELEYQMNAAAKEVAQSIEQAKGTSVRFDGFLAEKLQTAAAAAERELGPDPLQVTAAQLTELSRRTGVSHITLFRKDGSTYQAVRSSHSSYANVRVKAPSDWFAGMELLEAMPRGNTTRDENDEPFWSGTAVFSNNAFLQPGKWGFHRTEAGYFIAVMYDDSVLQPYREIASPDKIIERKLKSNPVLLEITGLDPFQFDGQGKAGAAAAYFGRYEYTAPEDAEKANAAYRTGTMVSMEAQIGEKRVVKSFIPVSIGRACVIAVVSDFGMISNALSDQLLKHIRISLALLVLVLAGSYLLADFLQKPLQRILAMVNGIAKGGPGAQVSVNRKDELGLLASRFNMMSQILAENEAKLRSTVDELFATKEYLESFINHTTDAIHVTDLQGRVQLVNHAFEDMFGWTKEEIVGRAVPTFPDELTGEAVRWLETVKEGGHLTNKDTMRMGKDGRMLEVSVTVSPIRDNRGAVSGVAVISRDITERKKTEEMLHRSEKLSLVGQLAAGVAHEIRNPLTTLRGFVQLQKSKGIGNMEHLDLMLSELDRINFIVSEFMILAKPQVSRFQNKDLRKIVDEVTVLMQPEAFLSNVRILTDSDEDVPEIWCEENQLKQVFINLLKNSIEAMADGGEIWIRVSAAGENRVMVRLIDQGCGIPEDQLSRLGEPFFTNKETGNGLGLMVSQQIIANHKGHMLIRSELGKGTCVDIVLPIRPG